MVSDLLKRYLLHKGYSVKHVMNLTDVDDKTIRGSMKKKLGLTEFTKKYEDAFFEDLKSLNIIPADKFPKATEHITEMVNIVNKLLEKGLAYKADDGVYFNVQKFKDYGKLANIDLENLKTGASGRVSADEYSKENVHDFALWKIHTPDDGEVFWNTALGKGRPGWHIECSAMSMKYLGETFDVHCGGIDLIFPHHQNEIAQSEGSTGKKFVNHWVHNEWLLSDGQKMSKSLGNFYTLRDVLKKGCNSMAVRYLLLATHYRQQLNFTFEGVDAAANSVERLQELAGNLKDVNGREAKEVDLMIKRAEKSFEQAMDDDLNVSEALAAVFEFVREMNRCLETGIGKKNAENALNVMKDFNGILGVIDFEAGAGISREQVELIEKREKLRKEGRFRESDEIREKLRLEGIRLDDTPEGIKWKRLK